jgi:molybdopterin-binding protein
LRYPFFPVKEVRKIRWKKAAFPILRGTGTGSHRRLRVPDLIGKLYFSDDDPRKRATIGIGVRACQRIESMGIYFISFWREKSMKISARNMLKGKIKSMTPGAVNSEVTIALPGGMEVVSIITKRSAKSLGLKKGKPVYAVVKASNVMIAVD